MKKILLKAQMMLDLPRATSLAVLVGLFVNHVVTVTAVKAASSRANEDLNYIRATLPF